MKITSIKNVFPDMKQTKKEPVFLGSQYKMAYYAIRFNEVNYEKDNNTLDCRRVFTI